MADKNNFAHKIPGAVDGEMVTRFPPEPSGYLHIGHAKAALMNQYIANFYHGKMLLRFDDTNPSKEKMEFEDSIIGDLALLNIAPSAVSHTSDFFGKLEETCTEMLRQGKFYVDFTDVERMRKERGEGIESQCRNQSVEENLRLWEEMRKGSEEGLKCCVRAKIDMQEKNKCLRDPVMFRCNIDIPHHMTGTTYKAYPTYDFACPLMDSWEGVTHALRTNEYADRIPQYHWVQKTVGVRETTVYEFSRLNFVNTVLSKRKLQHLVDTKVVEGWEDPRFPTVRGIRRRGLTVEALMEFIVEQGPTKNQNLMEWDKLWSKNAKILDANCLRFVAVGADAVPVLLENGVEEVRKRPLHPKDATKGECDLVLSKNILIERDDAALCTEGEEVTLMRWGNAFFNKIEKDAEGRMLRIVGTSNPEGNVKTTKKKLHWIADTEKKVRGVLREYDLLITKKKPEENDNFDDIVNRESLFETEVFIQPEFNDFVKVSDAVQFERRGYVRYDHILQESGKPVLIKIPDGKTKSMSTVSTKVDAKSLSKGTA